MADSQNILSTNVGADEQMLRAGMPTDSTTEKEENMETGGQGASRDGSFPLTPSTLGSNPQERTYAIKGGM